MEAPEKNRCDSSEAAHGPVFPGLVSGGNTAKSRPFIDHRSFARSHGSDRGQPGCISYLGTESLLRCILSTNPRTMRRKKNRECACSVFSGDAGIGIV